jgi:hypothetical protein
MDVGPEQLAPGQLHVVENANETDMPAGPGRAHGLHERLLGADRLNNRMRAQSVGEFLDPGHTFIATLFDDVGSAWAEPTPTRWTQAH